MKRYAVIGLGHFGFFAARALYENGCEVVAVDNNKGRVQAIDPYSTEAVCLDALDRDTLKTLGLEAFDGVVVSTGTRISNSILICLHLREIGVKRILVKAVDEDHGKILLSVGASEIIYPERDIAFRVARMLTTPNVLDFFSLDSGFELLQIEAPAKFIGKSLRELDLPNKFHVQVVAIKPLAGGGTDIPRANDVIKDGDRLVLAGRSEDINKLKLVR